ncbi:phosphoribosyltransferase [Deinococcus deserti]|uniref:Putative phosphoribosyltransferase n=1 Tax=Deinococcus deserti (strain DSM 17065 / CIP 109153 / LMG 22923 / VCD115) TaxID=546414 RepID=C1D2X8_DEIDV|nr:phosphoribosyltransferase [Deinococcus deserti]ACO47767.1 putative phosphoribosyltransferase [Deinococcus deserti VCD115]
MTCWFRDRADAGTQLAHLLHARGNWPAGTLVLGLPRGGVPVAAPVALLLRAQLDVLPVRKLGVPGWPEVAMGAIGSGDVRVLHEDLIARLNISETAIREVETRERTELARREAAYREGRSAPDLAGRTVILVDDGLATGATMRAAVGVVRAATPERIVVAVPVASPEASADLSRVADEVLCLCTPPGFRAVGQYYQNFTQTSDDEVRTALRAASQRSNHDTTTQGGP